MGLIFKRRERTRKAIAGPCSDCAVKDKEIAELAEQLREANAVAESLEIMRAKWEQLHRAKCEQYARLYSEKRELMRRLVEAELTVGDQ